MKSKEEIINDQFCGDMRFESYDDFKSEVGKCMEEYANQFKEQPKKSIEDRSVKFKESVVDVVSSNDLNVTWKTIHEFCDYWTEHGENAKKMRFEKEKVFDIKKRLERWNRNQKPTTNGTTTSEALNKFITE